MRAGDIRLDGARDSVTIRTRVAVVELERVSRAAIARILEAIDGRSTVGEIAARAARGLDPAAVTAVLQALVGFCVFIVPRADARPCRSLIVVDNFLADADARREEALRASYRRVPWFLFPGNYSEHEPENVGAIMQRIEELTGRRLCWGRGPIHGHYRCSLKTRRRPGGANVHTDPFSWNGVLCLSRDEDCRGGVSFYRHRRTGGLGRHAFALLRSGDSPEVFLAEDRKLLAKDGPDLAHWEEIGSVELRFNRLILFDPRQYHNVNTLFGTSPANARLTQGFSCYEPDDPYRFEEWV
jgi:hypothetical protein